MHKHFNVKKIIIIKEKEMYETTDYVGSTDEWPNKCTDFKQKY